MKWIYGMIADHTYPEFKKLYKEAVKNNEKEFIWERSPIRTNFAKYVCILIDKHLMQEYEEHIQHQIEAYISDAEDNIYIK